jgi:acyl carrier protein
VRWTPLEDSLEAFAPWARRMRMTSRTTVESGKEMEEQVLQSKVFAIIHELTGTQPADIKIEHHLREDLGMDSVSSMELVSMLSEEFNIDVDIEEAMQINTVHGVMNMARRYVSDAS